MCLSLVKMMTDEIRHILAGTGPNSTTNLIEAALAYLRTGQTTGRAVEETERFSKEKEAAYLNLWADQQQLWHTNLTLYTYIAEGAEQQVYLNSDGRSVLKTNDGIFYENWTDYFVSLLIHNTLFPATAYQLVGFYQKEEVLCAVVQQPFVVSTEPTDLALLRVFLENNGFRHRKNNDFFHPEWGIILEDLHDENVLVNQGVFFVIDSAIYVLNS